MRVRVIVSHKEAEPPMDYACGQHVLYVIVGDSQPSGLDELSSAKEPVSDSARTTGSEIEPWYATPPEANAPRVTRVRILDRSV